MSCDNGTSIFHKAHLNRIWTCWPTLQTVNGTHTHTHIAQTRSTPLNAYPFLYPPRNAAPLNSTTLQTTPIQYTQFHAIPPHSSPPHCITLCATPPPHSSPQQSTRLNLPASYPKSTPRHSKTFLFFHASPTPDLSPARPPFPADPKF